MAAHLKRIAKLAMELYCLVIAQISILFVQRPSLHCERPTMAKPDTLSKLHTKNPHPQTAQGVDHLQSHPFNGWDVSDT